MSTVRGNWTSDRTGGVKPAAAAASSNALPLTPSFCNSQLPASSTSCGFVDAIKTCDSTGSGYSAIGASSSSMASGVHVPDAAVVAIAGTAATSGVGVGAAVRCRGWFLLAAADK